MRKFYLLSILLFLIIGPDGNSQEKNEKSQIEMENSLIEQNLWQMILLIPPCNMSQLTMDDNEDYWYYQYMHLRSNKSYVKLIDTLLVLKPKLKIDSCLYPDESKKLSFYLNNIPTVPRKIQVPQNPTFYDIQTIQRKNGNESNTVELFLGTQMFSRIAFNNAQNEAYLVHIIKRKDCNLTILIAFSNQNGNWAIKRIYDISSMIIEPNLTSLAHYDSEKS